MRATMADTETTTKPKRKAKVNKGGRPPFKPTAPQRKKVMLLKATGMPHLSIAHVLKVAPNTLEKHFRRELDFGAAEIRAELTAKRYELAMMSDNVSALKHLFDQVDNGLPLPTEPARPAPPAEVAEEATDEEPKKKLGKKEQRKLDAVAAVADTDWSKLLRRPAQ